LKFLCAFFVAHLTVFRCTCERLVSVLIAACGPNGCHLEIPTAEPESIFGLLSDFTTFHLSVWLKSSKNLSFLQNVHEKLRKCQVYG
jgi:hypothetical protein